MNDQPTTRIWTGLSRAMTGVVTTALAVRGDRALAAETAAARGRVVGLGVACMVFGVTALQ